MNNIIIFVHTCRNYEESRAKKIENTWGNKDNVVFITDNSDSNLKNHIYIGEYEEGATYHPQNIFKMFRLFLTKYNYYDWFMIIDDDSYLYIDKLTKYLDFHDKNDCLMIGDFLNWPYIMILILVIIIGLVEGQDCIYKEKPLIYYELMINFKGGQLLNHDVWLHKLFKYTNQKSIKRIHCCGFHQYNIYKLTEEELKSMPSNLLISIHLNRQLDYLSKFHRLNNSY